jgi:hypothetical protein
MTRTGRYRIFPILGTTCVCAGVALLLLLDRTTGRVELCGMLLLGGCGMGLTAAPYMVATQNAIAPQVIGAATASLNLVRAIGASLAVSILGALLAGRARAVLSARTGAHAAKVDVGRLISGAGGPSVHHSPAVGAALLSGLHLIYIVAAIVGLAGIACALALQERTLSNRPAGG